jgi:hypothetical protein
VKIFSLVSLKVKMKYFIAFIFRCLPTSLCVHLFRLCYLRSG